MNANSALLWTLAVISLVGIAISGYLTSVHYADLPLVCSSDGVVSCERVLTSSYAAVGGIPWSVGGIFWFGGTGALALIALLRRPEPSWLQPAQVAWSLLGLVTVIYLIGVEVLAVDKICLWCSSLHVLIVVTFLIHLLRNPATEETM